MKRRTYTTTLEIEHGPGIVEYEVRYTVSPAEAPSRDCPGGDAEIDDLDVYYVYRAAAGVGAQTVLRRELRPELAGLIDTEELLEHAGEVDMADESAAVDRQVDEDMDRRRGL